MTFASIFHMAAWRRLLLEAKLALVGAKLGNNSEAVDLLYAEGPQLPNGDSFACFHGPFCLTEVFEQKCN